jgi:predicted RNA-binding Zn-ribbon protein involved in translation (DUF1610 family)
MESETWLAYKETIVPIKMTCPSCGKTLAAPDTAAGKKAKCPACGQIMIVPEAVHDAEELGTSGTEPARTEYNPVDDLFGVEGSSDEATSPDAPTPGEDAQRRPCPMCGELIVASAAKCRFCGAIFDRRLRGMPSRGGQNYKGFAITSMVLGILSLPACYCGFIFGIVAIVFGIIAKNGMAKSKNYDGKGMATAGLITGILGTIGWILFWIIIIIVSQEAQMGPQPVPFGPQPVPFRTQPTPFRPQPTPFRPVPTPMPRHR